jgi:hypothetical protein
MGRHGWIGTVLLAMGLAVLVSGPVVAIAQTDAPATYTRDLWSRPRLTGDFVLFLRQRLDLGLSVEDAVAMYYNAAITPWLIMAADLQILDSALNKTPGSSGQLVNMGTAVVGGLRMYVRF